MKKQVSLSLALVVTLAPLAHAAVRQQQTPPPASRQQPQPRPQDSSVQDDDVVRVTTNLVEVFVTDRTGRPVPGLRAEDFEVFEDGRKQQISNFSHINIGRGATDETTASAASAAANAATAAAAASSRKRRNPNPPPASARTLRREQVRRTVALVVDDLGLPFESMSYVRKALKKYVDEQMQPGDLVAILRTRGGSGTLQQFTTDKRLLYAAIERVKWFPTGRGDDVSSFGTLRQGAEDQTTSEKLRELQEYRGNVWGVGTLNALNSVVGGMKEMPGRKSILLFAESFPLTRGDSRSIIKFREFSPFVVQALDRLTAEARRSATAIYTINTSGLQTLQESASDSRSIQTVLPSAPSGNPVAYNPGGVNAFDSLSAQRRNEYHESQEVLDFLAKETGGLAIRNTNDISGGIQRTLDDQSSFYLLAYRSDEKTSDNSRPGGDLSKVTVKVRGSGLRVRTRSGFLSEAAGDAGAVATTGTGASAGAPREEQLRNAILSPFSSSGINVRLTSLFGNEEAEGSFMRSLLHLDARDLQFIEEADGTHKATIDLLAMTLDGSGQIVDQISGTRNISVRRDAFQEFLRDGVVSVLNVPVARPGAYQLRIAVRDAANERLGSASQFIEAPDLKRERMALSGIVLSGSRPRAAAAPSQPTHTAAAAVGGDPATKTASAAAANAAIELDTEAGPAVRRLRQGMVMDYGFLIYHAPLDKTGRPRVETQLRLFRDGQAVFTGSRRPLDASGQTD